MTSTLRHNQPQFYAQFYYIEPDSMKAQFYAQKIGYETDNHIEDMKLEFVTKLNKYIVLIKQQIIKRLAAEMQK